MLTPTSTLVFALRAGQVLLGYKKRGLGAGKITGAVTHSYWSEFFNRAPFDVVRDIEYDEPGGPITHGRFHTMTGYGNILIIDHGNGYMSLYAHNDGLLREAGDAVRRGDAVASVGTSGGQGRPALYFELRRNGAPVNPGTWLTRQ